MIVLSGVGGMMIGVCRCRGEGMVIGVCREDLCGLCTAGEVDFASPRLD